MMSGADPPYGKLTLEPCRFEPRGADAVGAEWGTLTVPENRRRPASNALTLSFVRLRCTGARPGNPIVFLAGGPGESGIDTARGSHFPLFMALRRVADVIALDQRGAGASRPSLRCEALAWQTPLDRPTGREKLLALALDKSRACAARLEAAGVDLAGYNTAESADDLDDLRAALGADRIDLWGMSYGTHLAFAALKRHSARIGRCLLGGAEGPDHTYKLPSVIERQAERMGGLVREHTQWGSRLPDLVSAMRDVLARLEGEPAEVALPDRAAGGTANAVIGRFDVEYTTAAGLADPRMLALLPAWYHGMSNGDFSLLARAPLLTRYYLHLKRGLGTNAMGLLMDCASGATRSRRERIEREAPTTVLGRTIDFPFPEIGEAWGNPDLGDDFRRPVRADNPVLFLSGSLDCRTPVDNVVEVQRGLSHSRAIVVEDAGHTDVFLSCPGFGDLARDFFAGEDVDTRPRMARSPIRFLDPDL
jgi:pimeloyl-ACP methyl ester carboxylesterase